VALDGRRRDKPFVGIETLHPPPIKESDMSIKAMATRQDRLTPNDHALLLIDHQSRMAFKIKSIDITAPVPLGICAPA
jgi:hypothetical protein